MGSPFQSRGMLKGSPASKGMASPSSRGMMGSPGLGGQSPGASRGALGRMHDCSMGQLHDAYAVLCRKVCFYIFLHCWCMPIHSMFPGIPSSCCTSI